MNRKGQISAGLTWFVAFVIIFFIMFLFVTASIIIAGTKKVSVMGGSGGRGEGEEGVNLILTEQVMSFLNIPIGDEKIRDLIIKTKQDNKYEDDVKNELEKIVRIFNPECYIFRAGDFIEVMDLYKYGGSWNNRGVQDDFFEKGGLVYIFHGSEKINVGLYIGECKL